MAEQTLINLYREATGQAPSAITAIAASGSNRRYYRIQGAEDLIGCIGESTEENDAFIYLSGHFSAKGLRVPRVVAVSPDRRAYLQTSLGDLSLFDFIAQGRMSGNFSQEENAMLSKTISSLADFQYAGAEGIDFSRCYPVEALDRRAVMWDLNYFKYCFLKMTGVDFNEVRLEDDFDRLADIIATPESRPTFLYRDFQSRNVMVSGGQPWFIDFQGGRRGPVEYDVASFLWQARASFTAPLREKLIDDYLASASRYIDPDPDLFRRRLRHFVLFRMLQVLGAYGFRGLHERKQHFIDSIPPALRNLRDLLSQPMPEYPTISALLDLIADKYLAETSKSDHLTVTITSFSYKKGIPDDRSGNGGGFIFDCRGMHNPGRYEEYSRLTGLDEPVIRFLEERGEVQPFVEACASLVGHSVETYLRRGFTSLTVGFGCTGGQHRSVYCAQQLGHLLADKYPLAEIAIIHREQNLSSIMPSRQ